MKNLIIILSIACSLQCLAQDPRLLDNTWYLQKVTYDGKEFLPPYDFITELYLYPDVFNYIYRYCNYGWSGDISYDTTNPEFNMGSDPIGIGDGCTDPDHIAFMILHDNNYYMDHVAPWNPFVYDIVTSGNTLQLTVTNINGDNAIYGNELLSVNDIDLINVTVSPNPFNQNLSISCESRYIKSIQIIDIGGKVVSNYNEFKPSNSRRIDLSDLKSGIYFVKIVTDIGQVTKKVIKE